MDVNRRYHWAGLISGWLMFCAAVATTTAATSPIAAAASNAVTPTNFAAQLTEIQKKIEGLEEGSASQSRRVDDILKTRPEEQPILQFVPRIVPIAQSLTPLIAVMAAVIALLLIG
jgi:hypothetical protein